MSVDRYREAYVILGMKFQQTDFNIQTDFDSEEICIFDRPEYDEDTATFCNFPWIDGGSDSDYYFLGQYIRCTEQQKSVGFNFDPSSYDTLKNEMKEKLEPLGLWDEHKFGYWLVFAVFA